MLELTEKRTLHSKTHDLGNGQHRLTASMIPMHYEDNGQLLDIDMTIQNGVVNSGLYKVELMTDKIGFHAIDRASGKKISVHLNKLGNNFIQYSAPTIEGNKAVWNGVRPGTDVELVFNPHQVNIFRVLHNSQADRVAQWDIEEEAGEKTIRMNNQVFGRDAAKNATKHTVFVSPPEQNEQRKKYTLHDSFDSRVLIRDPLTRVKRESSDVSYPVRIDPTITLTIANTTDDGVARKYTISGVTGITSFNNATPYDGVNKQDAGTLGIRDVRSFFRFPGITIPQSSTINSASLKPYILFNGGNPVDRIEARKLNNPAAPTNMAQVFNMASLATNVVNKTFTTANNNRANINVLSIVQELVNAFDYSNEAMLFFIRTVSTTSKYISFEDFSNAGTNHAQLVIDYNGGGVTPSRAPSRLSLMGCG